MGPLAVLDMARQAIEHLAEIRRLLEQLLDEQKRTTRAAR